MKKGLFPGIYSKTLPGKNPTATENAGQTDHASSSTQRNKNADFIKQF